MENIYKSESGSLEQLIISEDDLVGGVLAQICEDYQVTTLSDGMLCKLSEISDVPIELYYYYYCESLVGYCCFAGGVGIDSWDSDVYDSERSVMAVRRFDESFAVCPSCGFDFLYGSDHDCG